MTSAAPLVLLVEDDPVLRSFLSENLAADGFDPLEAGTAADGLRALEYKRPDVALVDLGLPDGSGLDLIARVRAADGLGSRLDPDVPLLVVTGRGAELDRLRGFERGADDYVVKPFSYGELRLRVRAVLRRSQGRRGAGCLRVGELEVDPAAHEARLRGTRCCTRSRASPRGCSRRTICCVTSGASAPRARRARSTRTRAGCGASSACRATAS
jgi:DNA-binding response OmpR family regulator